MTETPKAIGAWPSGWSKNQYFENQTGLEPADLPVTTVNWSNRYTSQFRKNDVIMMLLHILLLVM